MLYSRYGNPMEFMRLYIDQGRFGEFVSDTIAAENRRRTEQAEKEQEERLWNAYLHSYSEQSYQEWKAGILHQASPERPERPRKRDEDMTKKDIDNLLKRLFPNT